MNLASLIDAIKSNYDIDVIKELVNKCGDLNYEIDKGMTPLCYAVRCRRKPVILKFLINSGANVNALNSHRNIVSVFKYFNCNNKCLEFNCNYKEIIDILLNNGFNIKLTDERGSTVLHYVRCKYLITLAIKCGVSIESAGRRGYTPLTIARINDDFDKVKFLLSLNANPNCVDFSLNTPLHKFVYIGENSRIGEVVDLLVYYGADLLAQDKYGKTPLHELSDDNLYVCKGVYAKFEITLNHRAIIKNVLLFISDVDMREYLDASEDSDSSSSSSDSQDIYTRKRTAWSYIHEYNLELFKMKTVFIKKGLTFYDFCIAKKLIRSNFIDISFNQYKYNIREIRSMFPNYSKLILLRIFDNHRVKLRKILLSSLGNINLSPFKLGDSLMCNVLPYDCFHLVSKYLSTKQLYNLFSASLK